MSVVSRVFWSLLVAIVVAIGTVMVWANIKQTEIEQGARVIEVEALSDRRELSRNLETITKALGDVREFWEEFAGLPEDQWEQDARIELRHFDGLESILWFANNGESRFLNSPDHSGFGYRPTDEELKNFADYIEILKTLEQDEVRGPYDRDGDLMLQAYFVSEQWGSGGLVASINVTKMIEHIYRDVSPAYSVSVSNPEFTLFTLKEPALELDDSWTIDGLVDTSFGTDWTVVHAPTEATADQLTTPATNMILYMGLLIAVMLGVLTYEYAGALVRARKSEIGRQELAVAKDDLENVVAERTAELSQRNADLQTITDSVAHDMRNPLNSISMTTQLLNYRLRGKVQDEEIELLARVEPSIRQMADIVDRLVGLSVMAHSTFERETIDMKATTQEIFDGLIAGEPPPEVNLTLDELPETFADSTLVKAVIMNLLSNALKYTRDNDERNVHVGSQRKEAQTVYFVKDNGIGFDENSGRKMFEAFARLDGAEDVEGLGLGLTIVNRIIHRHEGQLWAEGAVGEGATFFFTLQAGEANS